MYAVIECGGTQVRVSENQKVRIPRIDAQEGQKYKMEKVLLLSNGQDVIIGQPTIKDAIVEVTVVGHSRSAKISAMIYKPKKDYRRRWGARTHYTDLLVNTVSHPKIKAIAKPATPAVEKKKAPKKAPAAKPAAAKKNPGKGDKE
ncbi:MAG: 50S ribosomal protein L21 [Candidatus Edwardsbacteria bacterium]|nr:50S ribosomal protein L21 [Candidatus Edwardsbacteria bacterium]